MSTVSGLDLTMPRGQFWTPRWCFWVPGIDQFIAKNRLLTVDPREYVQTTLFGIRCINVDYPHFGSVLRGEKLKIGGANRKVAKWIASSRG